jgi:two-component system chemotaxis response regulator CheB
MPAPIRILVAEDSLTQRELLLSIIRADPDLQTVGVASDGLEAVTLARQLRPDLITMDVEMPRLNGLEATKEIMIADPTPIVLVSALDQRAVQLSMQTLNAGALTVLRKPPGPSDPSFPQAAREFVRTIKALSQVKVVRHWHNRRAASQHEPDQPQPAAAPLGDDRRPRPEIVAIAASTGGPAALHHLLSNLPPSFHAPILIVQHIGIGFAEGLAKWWNESCPLRVKVAEEGELVMRGTVYLAPAQLHLGLTSSHMVKLDSAPPINGFRPSADYLFRSLAALSGVARTAVILTGMGDDGLAGLRELRKRGATIIAQDERTSTVFGMNQAAIRNQLVDHVLPIYAIAARLEGSPLLGPP